ncbi:NYN domain-containing protein [Pedobacter sp. SYP-B3415]|uniref:NYN domain-containing protein n=1 Tax=Pedobacter sp. SYP-B3415 TaxID=2496641 RepID=UPI00101CE666|nr:NYN domain-containing protein [Pedobacter sp. SYP-B3415]
MEKKIERMAILVDGDNAQAKLLKDILEEVAKYGKVTVRRIYGDWTRQGMNSWKNLLNDLSFTPMQKFSYTSGKNSTDGALIIDAMDILHNKLVDGFCIVSSDSDYTGLAKRIREEGVFVMGIGEKKTPAAFINSCEIFTFTQNIMQEAVIEKQEIVAEKPLVEKPPRKTGRKKAAEVKPEQTPADFVGIQVDLVDKAYFMASPEDIGVHVSTLGTNLRKIDPSFDSRTHGFRTLSKLLESIEHYEVYKPALSSQLYVKLKQKSKLKPARQASGSKRKKVRQAEATTDQHLGEQPSTKSAE